ncbi:TetR/AcrR family transcriptional regulator [Actinoallomurus rhizosphaericola]|uniref:TetR/AcrR family transcriptional regulator n=1 Tax=Actinoallomurus rhizosphaericola TaxID=2952536 RepID=UPI00209296F0|nr:TetR family transcriptional regulator [Actinoallomurus rhizosphaericola]MCO5996513.1 TetR family transcriptional regulator [Actinoallomurus rhizosphaericola]
MPRDTAAATKEALLGAAREEFAAYGIAGARVDRIAERAGVNKERIYGHFGNKEKLFDAVMSQVLDEVVEMVSQEVDDVGDYVARLYDYHREHPDLQRLLLWEALHYGGKREFDEGRRAHYRRKIERLARGLGAEPSVDVGRTLLTVCGMAAWPTAVPQMARLILGPDADDQGAMRAHLIEFARSAVARKAPA